MAGALVTTNVLSTVVAMGLKALRDRLVMGRIVNREYEGLITARKRGSTVNVAVPAAITVRSVSPDVVPPAVTAVTPTSVAITLDQWYEAPFAMDDKGLARVDAGILPMQASEAVKAIANKIEDHLMLESKEFYTYVGTAGTTPFASALTTYLDARKGANNNLMEDEPRYVILDNDAESNALGLSQFLKANERGDTGGIIKGTIGEKLGAQWLRASRVYTHEVTGAGTVLVNDASVAVGDTTLTWDGGGTAPAKGDIFTVAGDTQTYVVESSSATVITMFPAAVVAWADNAAVTFKADTVNNLLITRNSIAFAMAPLLETVQMPGPSMQAVAIDEDSGLSLRLEVTRQHKQWQWSYDALYGSAVVRRSDGVIIAG
jgi:hypothetical protein|tara:strand:+ start:1178 stop:2302 length:1125 start_codon:yes stop_codon:yes gene_type:complete